MPKSRLCGLTLIALFLLVYPRYSYGEIGQELEPLVVVKRKQLLLSEYSSGSSRSEAFNYQSQVESLVYLPVDVQSRSLRSGIEAGFSLRGSTIQQVLVLLNGQRINEPQTAYYNSDIPFTKEDISAVTVIPGAGSGLFGPDAVGGAVNFSLKAPGEKKMVLETGMGNNRNGYGLFSVSDSLNGLGLRFSIEDSRSDGYRYDTDYEKFTSSFSSAYELPCGSWVNNFGYQEKDFGAYDFYTPAQGYPSREKTRTYLFNSGADLDYDDFSLRPNFLWRRHYDRFILDETGERSNSVNRHRTDMFTPGIYLRKEAGRLGKIGFGSEWSEEKITSTNLGRHSRRRYGVFLDNNLVFDGGLEVGSCLRWETFSGFGPVYTGSLNTRLALGHSVSWSAGVSRSMRLPSFTELYYSDPTTEGNDSLAAEKVWNYETGLEYRIDGFVSKLCLFMRDENEMIDWVRSDPSQKWQAKNFTRDKVAGVECFLRKDFNRALGLEANYSYADKRIDSQGYFYKYGPNYARHLVNTVFNLSLPFGKQEIGFNYKKRPGRRGWLLVNCGLNYDLNPGARVFLHMENVLNVEYQDIEGIPQPGRYIEAGVRLNW